MLLKVMRLYQVFEDGLGRPIDRQRMMDGMRQLRAERHGHATGEPDWCCT